MSTNLADLNAAKASEIVFNLELRHPISDAPLGLFAQVVGMQSERFRQLRDQQANEMLKQNFEAQRKNKPVMMTVDTAAKRSSALLARATVGWYEQQPVEIGEKPKKIDGWPFGETRLMFTEDAAIQLYSDPAYEWLQKQVDDAIGELSNFMKP